MSKFRVSLTATQDNLGGILGGILSAVLQNGGASDLFITEQVEAATAKLEQPIVTPTAARTIGRPRKKGHSRKRGDGAYAGVLRAMKPGDIVSRQVLYTQFRAAGYKSSAGIRTSLQRAMKYGWLQPMGPDVYMRRRVGDELPTPAPNGNDQVAHISP